MIYGFMVSGAAKCIVIYNYVSSYVGRFIKIFQ